MRRTKVVLHTVGSDPELAIWDPQSNKYIPSERFEKNGLGTKEEPVKKDGYSFSVDNVSLEYSTPVAQTEQQFVDYVHTGVQMSQSIVGEEYVVKAVSSATYDVWDLMRPVNSRFGCDPDFSAYTGDVNVKPPPEIVNPYRFFGGHVHIGYDDPDEHTSREIIKILDQVMYKPYLQNGGDPIRKRIYGSPGNHRIKPYGFEYRTPPAELTVKDPGKVFRQVKLAIQMFNEGVRYNCF